MLVQMFRKEKKREMSLPSHAPRVSELANSGTKKPLTKEGKCCGKTRSRHNTVTSNPDIAASRRLFGLLHF